MHIAFLSKSIPVIGGVESWLDDLVTGLAVRGHRTSVGLAQGARFHDAARYGAAHPQLGALAMVSTTGSETGRRLAVLRMLRRLRPDVVVPVMLHDALAMACATRARFGHRVVYPVHEVNPGVGADLRALGTQMDMAVAVDPRSHEQMARHAPGLPARLVPCGVPHAAHLRAGSGGAQPVIGVCGRLEHEAKRVMDVAAVVRELRRLGQDCELWMAGEGGARGRLLQALAETGVALRDLGCLSRQQLYERFYPGVDILLLCSETETGPLVAFEAMAHGTLVVCADFQGRDRAGALRHEDNCLVFPIGDAAGAAGAIRLLLCDPVRAQRMRNAASAFARRERVLSRTIDAWQALLEEVRPVARTAAGAVPALPGPVQRARESARRVLGRRFAHASARAEWPYYAD